MITGCWARPSSTAIDRRPRSPATTIVSASPKAASRPSIEPSTWIAMVDRAEPESSVVTWTVAGVVAQIALALVRPHTGTGQAASCGPTESAVAHRSLPSDETPTAAGDPEPFAPDTTR